MANLTLVQPKRTETGRLLRFLMVGAGGTLVDFGILTLLKSVIGLPTLPANLVSFSAGILNNFTFNRLWTYADSRGKHPLAQLGQFALVSVIGLLLNTSIVLLLETPLNALFGAAWGYLPAKVVATGVVVLWNFSANRYWTFNDVE